VRPIAFCREHLVAVVSRMAVAMVVILGFGEFPVATNCARIIVSCRALLVVADKRMALAMVATMAGMEPPALLEFIKRVVSFVFVVWGYVPILDTTL